MKELIFTHCMWAYLVSMPMHLIRGTRGLPGEPSTYGNIDPDVDYAKKESYYVGVAEGMRDGRPLGSRDLDYGHFYPERTFVWGHDKDHNPLGRTELLELLKPLRAGAIHHWDPCQVWRGYKEGKPTWYTALRNDAHYLSGVSLRLSETEHPEHWEVYTESSYRTHVWIP